MGIVERSEPFWVCGRTNVGFVVTTNDVGEKKVRVAAVLGHDEAIDANDVADYGAKLDVVAFCRWISDNSQYLVQPILIHQGNVKGLHPDVDVVEKLRKTLGEAIAVAKTNLIQDLITFNTPVAREIYVGLIRDWEKVYQETGGR